MNGAPIPVAQYEQRQAKGLRLVRTNTNTIMATEFAPIKWVVQDFLPEGLSVLAGRQKLGKTWLALDWAIAVACGGMAMGSVECEQGDVLYIDLENGHRRIQGRINILFPDERQRPHLSRLEWANDAPDLDKGFLGSGLIDQSQKITDAAMHMADMKVWAQRS